MAVAAGETITDDQVREILANVPTDTNLPGLMEATSNAHTAWKAFTESNKVKLEIVPNATEGA